MGLLDVLLEFKLYRSEIESFSLESGHLSCNFFGENKSLFSLWGKFAMGKSIFFLSYNLNGSRCSFDKK